MDDKRFDAWSRVLATATDRRRTLRGLAGMLAGGGAAIVAAEGAGAANVTCRHAGQKCVRNGQCCSAMCATSRSIPRSQRNRCVCGELSNCNGDCVDKDTNTKHCGECGVRCQEGQSCCDGQCVDLQEDADNCGVCGRVCNACWQGWCFPDCNVQSSGTCGANAFCMLDEAGTMRSANGWGLPGAFIPGCLEENGPECPAGSVCMVGSNQFGPWLGFDDSQAGSGTCFIPNECVP